MARLTADEKREMRERCDAATAGPWQFDGDNTICDYQHRIILTILDHPLDLEPYAPEQIAERSAWYKESSANAWFAQDARTDLPHALEEIDALEAERAELVEALRPYVTGKHCFPCTCDAHNEAYARAAELLVRMEGK